jgi:hypothetical protein
MRTTKKILLTSAPELVNSDSGNAFRSGPLCKLALLDPVYRSSRVGSLQMPALSLSILRNLHKILMFINVLHDQQKKMLLQYEVSNVFFIILF